MQERDKQEEEVEDKELTEDAVPSVNRPTQPIIEEPRKPRKSNQFRALSRKALSFQKRQIFTNVCCISLCPMFMVIISALLGNAIQGFIQTSQGIEDVLYCSNNNSLNNVGYPIYILGDYGIYGSNVTNGKATNFARVVAFADYESTPGADSLNFWQPCVFWFGSDFPRFSPIYEKNANLTGIAKLDSTYAPPPDGGFYSIISNTTRLDVTMVWMLSQLQLKTWAITGASRPELDDVLGAKPQEPIYQNLTSLLRLVASAANSTNTTPPFLTSPASSGGPYGLLGAIENRYFFNASLGRRDRIQFEGVQPVPYFVPAQTLKEKPSRITLQEIDEILATRIRQLIISIPELNNALLSQSSVSTGQIAAFNIRAANLTRNLPYGALYLDEFRRDDLYARFMVQAGGDRRITSAATFPAEGKRQMWFLTQMSRAMLKAFRGTGTITQGVRIFPSLDSTKIDFPFGGLVGRVLYPFGVSFLIPVFVLMLVKEKEDRILIMMKMNGMKIWAYYLVHYITFYVMFILSSAVFLISGTVAKMQLFTNTDLRLILLLFFIWGHIQIVLSFFFASFFNKTRIALIIVFVIVLCGVMVSIVFERLYTKDVVPSAVFMWPPFAFYRALSVMNKASYSKQLAAYTLARLQNGDEVFTATMFLVVGYFVFGLLALYFSAVLPSDFGIQRPWHFPVTDLITLCRRSRSGKEAAKTHPRVEVALDDKITVDDDELKYEDEDVKAERQRVVSNKHSLSSPVVVSGVRKVFAGRRGLGPKVAVKDVTFAAEKGVIVGLLGPNGAGKTTLISILTGIYGASAGSAKLDGFDVGTQSGEVYKVIGVCPQFDILWDDLTVSEHLYFYARLKGVSVKGEKEAVQKSLDCVHLTTLQHRTAKRLSGGEKRRLSIAIALVGDPSVVFLDEPTTGLDPEVRRLVWNIIQNAKEGKTIILTTHSMEEAEALCQRVGIMAKGTLRCLANPLRLKELYGSGFRVFFNSKEEDTERACEWIESLLPEGWGKMDSFATNTSYEFPHAAGIIPRLFVAIEEGKEAYGIVDWGVSQTTLEEVFVKIITDDDANAD
ncbi:hypothetical protein BC829DRAFT_207092 [Chytridium lagenaria]|nr:hypothetical protein BC829DRAFT_207092 [Chytridium lagenaria]